jgi:hypothetical protein
MKRLPIIASIAILALCAASLATWQHKPQIEKSSAALAQLDEAAQKAGASQGWMAKVAEQMRQDELQAFMEGGQARIFNRDHNLNAKLDSQSLRVESAKLELKQDPRQMDKLAAKGAARLLPSPTPNAADWGFEWKTEKFGRAGSMQAIAAGKAETKGVRMSLKRAQFEEWYENRPEGIEQGFTIVARPAGQGEVRLESAAINSCRLKMEQGEVRVQEGGKEVLRYGALKVVDAKGQVLESRMELDGCRIVLAYEDAGAQYPVIVDPLIVRSTLSAPSGSSFFGNSVASAGDVNGDGYGDVIIGSSNSNRAYLYLGRAWGLLYYSPVTLTGPSGSYFGVSVASAGDFNGDGYGDVVIGASYTAYLYFGSSGGLVTPPVVLTAPSGSINYGNSVASAGDVNGDGYGDMIVGAPNSNTAYLYLGSLSGTLTTPVTLAGPLGSGNFGNCVASAGDVNGDGYGDVTVGTNGSDTAYLYLGSASGLASAPVTLSGPSGSQFGNCVASAGDANGDGYGDVIIGAIASNTAYLYLGSTTGLVATPATLTGPSGSKFGYCVAGVGDVN